ncbi:MAG: hypothetical protein C0594_07080 [Marinilabiliales bacterium]|nr:MAG: hypothetical protein C0594_07080 [Marinilabiliales bacterium]
MDTTNTKHGFLEFVYDFYKTMKLNEINLVYEGEITHQITKAFTSLTEASMEKEDEPSGVQRKVFHVMVECLQNISKHAENSTVLNDPLEGRGIFMVSRGDDMYKVTTGNVIDNTKVEHLREFIDHINSLNKDELKLLYKKQIKEGRLSEKGGAGLGFIDIVRKTGQPLDVHFLPVNENASFFILISTITRK